MNEIINGLHGNIEDIRESVDRLCKYESVHDELTEVLDLVADSMTDFIHLIERLRLFSAF